MREPRVSFIDVEGKPFEHFERGVTYTAKPFRRGLVMIKKTRLQENPLSVFKKAVRIDD